MNANLKSESLKILVESMNKTVEDSKAETSGRGWKLADTITLISVDAENLIARGGVLASYAGFPEFGTIYQYAKPYWMPFVWSNFFIMQDKLQDAQRRLSR
jgi:hypothetical protein